MTELKFWYFINLNSLRAFHVLRSEAPGALCSRSYTPSCFFLPPPRHVVFGPPVFHFPSSLSRPLYSYSTFMDPFVICGPVLSPSPGLSTDVSCFCILLYIQVWNALILGIILRYFVWKKSIFFSSVFVSFYVLHPYNNTEMIRLWKERLFCWCYLPSKIYVA